jgi:UDP-3-O-[3-hydroxymyristoyl] N-acetylglucosamine deacetylase / 3-hydroxyacyl-[acyl-carrier-protein] dehydratase
MPGVLQIEAMAQTGGILALANVPEDEVWDTYFLKIESAKFKSKIQPGDTMIIKLELVEPIRRGIVHMKGVIFVGNKITTEADMIAQVVKRT